MSKKFYRFRSIDNLIGTYNELESQTIYFAHPQQLNDPMEGYRDIYWKGDGIAWKNLLKHYLLCLERFCSLLSIGGETISISEHQIPVFFSELDLPTPEYQSLFSEIATDFFRNKNVITMLASISKRSSTVRRDELFCYLRMLHPTAIEAIYKTYNKHGLTNYKEFPQKNSQQASQENMFKLLDKEVGEDVDQANLLKTIFQSIKTIFLEMDLVHLYNNEDKASYKNRKFLFYDFSEKYISQLEQLIYPEWYVACFMSEKSIKNSSLWGNYGSKHEGVCLIFNSNTTADEYSLDLNQTIGWGSSGSIYGTVKHKFEKVDYVKGFGEVNFFKSLGRLSISKLNSTWYLDNGAISICADDIFSDEAAWRKRYWDVFHRDLLIKTKDWEYEDEYRLILASGLNSFDESKDRLLKYDFNSLNGLIFGIKTKHEDKVKIIKIIEEKCKKTNRKDFKFYQARYSSEDKCIVNDEMSFLNF